MPKKTVLNEDDVIARILNAETYAQIAKAYGVTVGALTHWISGDAQRTARAREARTATANYWDEKAEQVIEQAKDPLELQKARELAHHYRWRAAKIAPKQYGDKVEVDNKGEVGLNITIKRFTGDDE